MQNIYLTSEERSFTEGSITRGKAALLAKIDLTSTDARMDANGLIRRLKIRTELIRLFAGTDQLHRQAGRLADIEGV